MSTHKDCGAEVFWPRRDDDPSRAAPPIEAVGMALILTEENVVIQVQTYRRHVCDPDQMEKWIRDEARRKALRESLTQEDTKSLGQSAYQQDKQRRTDMEQLRDEKWEDALKRKCPRCQQKAGFRCVNLTQKKKGVEKFTVWPHPERESTS